MRVDLKYFLTNGIIKAIFLSLCFCSISNVLRATNCIFQLNMNFTFGVMFSFCFITHSFVYKINDLLSNEMFFSLILRREKTFFTENESARFLHSSIQTKDGTGVVKIFHFLFLMSFHFFFSFLNVLNPI